MIINEEAHIYSQNHHSKINGSKAIFLSDYLPLIKNFFKHIIVKLSPNIYTKQSFII